MDYSSNDEKRRIITPRYFFVNLKINNDNKGLHAFEESYGKEMLENTVEEKELFLDLKDQN